MAGACPMTRTTLPNALPNEVAWVPISTATVPAAAQPASSKPAIGWGWGLLTIAVATGAGLSVRSLGETIQAQKIQALEQQNQQLESAAAATNARIKSFCEAAKSD